MEVCNLLNSSSHAGSIIQFLTLIALQHLLPTSPCLWGKSFSTSAGWRRRGRGTSASTSATPKKAVLRASPMSTHTRTRKKDLSAFILTVRHVAAGFVLRPRRRQAVEEVRESQLHSVFLPAPGPDPRNNVSSGLHPHQRHLLGYLHQDRRSRYYMSILQPFIHPLFFHLPCSLLWASHV